MPWSLSLPSDASPLTVRWLTATGALTAHLETLGRVRLQVLRETLGPAAPDETEGPAAAAPGCYFIREVLMAIDGTPAVAARSLVPDGDGGPWVAVKTLRTTPLAKILYTPETTRTPFAFAALEATMALRGVTRPFIDGEHALLARRSVFTRAGVPILVSEAFLPGFWAIAA